MVHIAFYFSIAEGVKIVFDDTPIKSSPLIEGGNFLQKLDSGNSVRILEK